MSEAKYKRWWNMTYHGNQSNYEMFKKWCIDRNITRINYRYETKIRGSGLFKNRVLKSHVPYFRDHTTDWTNKYGDKIIVLQPYDYLPNDVNSCFGKTNKYYNKAIEREAAEKVEKLKKWCNLYGLEVYFYKSEHSWYYPCHTILIEIVKKKIIHKYKKDKV